MKKWLLVVFVAAVPCCFAQYQSAQLQPAVISMKGNFSGTTNSRNVLDACSVALTASKAFSSAALLFDFGGDQACGTHMLSTVVLGDASTFSGSLSFSTQQGLLLHQYGTDGALLIPPRTNLKGGGQSTAAPTSANGSGTVFQACQSGDTHAYCNGSAGTPSVGLLATVIKQTTANPGITACEAPRGESAPERKPSCLTPFTRLTPQATG